MKKALYIFIVLLSFFLFLTSALAVSTPTLVLNLWSFDPQKICPGVESVWQYSQDENSPILFLSKPCLTSTPSSVGATILGMNIQPLMQLGFDLTNDGFCGYASPRYTVYTAQGAYYFPGCSAKWTDLKKGWKRVKFSDKDAIPINDAPEWPGFGKVIVTDLEFVFDEFGTTQIDNLKINDQMITGPTPDQQIDGCKKDGWLNYVIPGPFNSQQGCINYFVRINL